MASVRVAGVQRELAVRRRDTFLIGAALIIGVGSHKQRLTRPLRIGMLAIDFLELLCRFLRFMLDIEVIETLVVEAIGRFVGRLVVAIAAKIDAATGAQTPGQKENHRRAREGDGGGPPGGYP